MRDEKLLRVFLNHLHEKGALSVPPEDLHVAVEEVAKRFSTAEGLQYALVVLKAVKEDSNAKK